MIVKTRSNRKQSDLDFNLNSMFRRLFAVRWYGQLSNIWRTCLPIAAVIIIFWNIAAVAEKAPPDAIKMAEELKVNLDTAWVTIAAMLVIFMNAGFCMLETGFCRHNACEIHDVKAQQAFLPPLNLCGGKALITIFKCSWLF